MKTQIGRKRQPSIALGIPGGIDHALLAGHPGGGDGQRARRNLRLNRLIVRHLKIWAERLD
ncbi:hypothetical protein [Ferrimicrobium acidiphilum]|uniref:hypothetical protein n=1 Tax=Ferrimicrobium acidiphilum TaxID=121039 RepID=UPI0012E0C08F|nr:hypothetical protein [Ferrimicrobium acidiphilum]